MVSYLCGFEEAFQVDLKMLSRVEALPRRDSNPAQLCKLASIEGRREHTSKPTSLIFNLCAMLMLEMEYAISDICLLECVFKWSVSRPISGSSESILARYVCQVVSKHTKLDSHGEAGAAESYWREPNHRSCGGSVCL